MATCEREELGLEGDRRALEEAVKLDERTLTLLREAETAAAGGDRTTAADRMRDSVLPAAERALEHAHSFAPATKDGRAARDELLAVLELRREAVVSQLDAVESGDAMRMLDAIRRTREVERAMLEWEAEAKKLVSPGREGRRGCPGCSVAFGPVPR